MRSDSARAFHNSTWQVPMLFNMFKKRLRSYRAIGYARGEAPLGLEYDGDHETVVEYDEEAQRHFDEEE